MSVRPFFDTTTLIYTLAKEDPRATIAEGLLLSGGYISVQVLNEFTAVSRRKFKMSWEEVTGALVAIRALCRTAAPLNVRTHESALQIAQRYGFQIYDSLILAAALEAECDVLYSEDMQDGFRIEGLSIVNPFLGAGRSKRG